MEDETRHRGVVEKEVPGADKDLPLFRMKRFVWMRWSVKKVIVNVCLLEKEKKY